MAEEKEEGVKPEENEKPPKDKKKLIIIIVIAVLGVLVLAGGGYFGYKMLSDKDNGENAEPEHEEAAAATGTVMVAFDPFILNLADRGRYLKLAIQVELSDQKHENVIDVKLPQLRDAIIMLISDKSAQSISSAEGKFQLKEEILYRLNYVIGLNEDVITSIYFTSFVMQ